jgi:hypothetical protein
LPEALVLDLVSAWVWESVSVLGMVLELGQAMEWARDRPTLGTS